MGPQFAPAEFSLVPCLGPPRRFSTGSKLSSGPGAGWPSWRAGALFVGERHDRLSVGQGPGDKVASFPLRGRGAYRSPAWLSTRLATVEDRRRRVPPPRALVSTAWDCSQCLATASVTAGCVGYPRRLALGRWLFGRHPIRPVLKHGPRSLTSMRVFGCVKPWCAMKVKGLTA